MFAWHSRVRCTQQPWRRNRTELSTLPPKHTGCSRRSRLRGGSSNHRSDRVQTKWTHLRAQCIKHAWILNIHLCLFSPHTTFMSHYKRLLINAGTGARAMSHEPRAEVPRGLIIAPMTFSLQSQVSDLAWLSRLATCHLRLLKERSPTPASWTVNSCPSQVASVHHSEHEENMSNGACMLPLVFHSSIFTRQMHKCTREHESNTIHRTKF